MKVTQGTNSIYSVFTSIRQFTIYKVEGNFLFDKAIKIRNNG